MGNTLIKGIWNGFVGSRDPYFVASSLTENPVGQRYGGTGFQPNFGSVLLVTKLATACETGMRYCVAPLR